MSSQKDDLVSVKQLQTELMYIAGAVQNCASQFRHCIDYERSRSMWSSQNSDYHSLSNSYYGPGYSRPPHPMQMEIVQAELADQLGRALFNLNRRLQIIEECGVAEQLYKLAVLA